MPLDIGLGFLVAIVITKLTMLPLDVNVLMFAVIFSVLPDFDFPLHLAKKGQKELHHEHRDLFHNPLIFLPIGFLLISFININMALLFFFCVLFHFIHDSIGMGWGVRWLYPFSKRYYKFFSKKDGKMSKNFLSSWAPQEQREVALQFGDPDWLKKYLRGSPHLLLELLVFIISLAYLFYVWREQSSF